MMVRQTRIHLGRREDLGADCANCLGLCCVALAFAKSADFPVDKPAGDPCTNLDDRHVCRIHPHLRDRGFKGCTVFDCFGAGQKVSRRTSGGRSWRDDALTRAAMFEAFPIVRRLHELLWYLDEAIALVEPTHDASAWQIRFEHVRRLSDQPAQQLVELDVDAEFDATRDLLLAASRIARGETERGDTERRETERGGDRSGSPGPQPGSDLIGARLAGADFRGVSLRGSRAIAADFSRANFSRCDVLGMDLRDANLAGADLHDAIFLTQMQVNSARGDHRTTLPNGFQRPSHWS